MAKRKKKVSLSGIGVVPLEIPLKYYGVDQVTGIFADQAMVSHTPEAFTILFFQTQSPPTEDPKVLLSLKEMPTKCVARIVVTPTLMHQFYTALGKNLQKYQNLVERFQKELQGAKK